MNIQIKLAMKCACILYYFTENSQKLSHYPFWSFYLSALVNIRCWQMGHDDWLTLCLIPKSRLSEPVLIHCFLDQ
jgi:hypothetical protein